MFYLGLLGFLIGSTFFLGAGTLWYLMARREYRHGFHALCPETMQPVDIRIDATHAARTRFAGHEELEISACTRWPERRGCNQACAPQVPFLGDSRVKQDIAVFGTTPHPFEPVHMTPELFRKIQAQL